MDFNAIMRMRETWNQFCSNHPKFPQFISAVNSRGIPEGSVIDIAITYPDGQKMSTNMRISAQDLELLRSFKNLPM